MRLVNTDGLISCNRRLNVPKFITDIICMFLQCHVIAAFSLIRVWYVAYVLSKLHLKPDYRVNNIHNSVSASQKTLCLQYKCHLLMFREVTAVCSKGHMEQHSCEQNV
jgi:hypothetical protein